VRGRFYHLHYRPNGLDTARLGVAVAKKLAKRANTRNLVKRIARELFRRERASLPACDLIARLQVSPIGVSRAQLNQDLRTLFTRLPRPSATD
jgi:ribonuclease P protein component